MLMPRRMSELWLVLPLASHFPALPSSSLVLCTGFSHRQQRWAEGACSGQSGQLLSECHPISLWPAQWPPLLVFLGQWLKGFSAGEGRERRQALSGSQRMALNSDPKTIAAGLVK